MTDKHPISLPHTPSGLHNQTNTTDPFTLLTLLWPQLQRRRCRPTEPAAKLRQDTAHTTPTLAATKKSREKIRGCRLKGWDLATIGSYRIRSWGSGFKYEELKENRVSNWNLQEEEAERVLLDVRQSTIPLFKSGLKTQASTPNSWLESNCWERKIALLIRSRRAVKVRFFIF